MYRYPADLSKHDDCVRLAEELQKREKGESAWVHYKMMRAELGPVLHVLVNNSGATWGEDLKTYPDSAWTKLMTLNVQRVFTLTQKLLPMIEAAGKRDGVGRVINVSPPLAWRRHDMVADRLDRSDRSTVSVCLRARHMPTRPAKPRCTCEQSVAWRLVAELTQAGWLVTLPQRSARTSRSTRWRWARSGQR